MQFFETLKNEIISTQPTERRDKLREEFDKLLEGVEMNSHANANRDKYESIAVVEE